MYKVINRFQEKNHEDHVYEAGDPYPVEGQKLVKTRADFLTKVHPEYDVAFLEIISESKKASAKQSSKELSSGEKSDAE